MRDHRTTAELERVVGPERTAHSAGSVARAERELGLRGEGEEALFQRKLTRAGTIAAAIGAFCIVWPAVMLVLFSQFDRPTGRESLSAPFVFRHFDSLFTAIAILQILCGVMLLIGGLGIRARRRIGPLLAALPIVVAMVYTVAFPLSTLDLGGNRAAMPAFSVVFTTFSLFWSGLLCFLLWLPLRFFVSARVKDACTL